MPQVMRRRSTRRLRAPALLALCALLALPAAAAAAGHGTVHLVSKRFFVHEGAGAATIGIVRSDPRGGGAIRYGVWHRTADYDIDYKPVHGRLDFADGQREVTFRVPIVDDPYVEGRETIAVGIYGAYPQRLVDPKRATLTILDDDTISTERDRANPLALDPPPPARNPLLGATFFTNPQRNLAGTVIEQIRHRRPVAARLLQTIAEEPENEALRRVQLPPGRRRSRSTSRRRRTRSPARSR